MHLLAQALIVACSVPLTPAASAALAADRVGLRSGTVGHALRVRVSGSAERPRRGPASMTVGWAAFLPSQAEVTQGDIQRLQDRVFEISGEIDGLPSRDGERARRLREELGDLREEVIYLKVKLRKAEDLSRAEYLDLRDRLDGLRIRTGSGAAPANETSAPAPGPPRTAPSAEPAIIPVNTELDVRLQSTLDSGTAEVEDRFGTTTVVDLTQGERVLIPAGSVVRGVVTSVDRAGRTSRTGRLGVRFDRLSVGGRSYTILGTVTELLESEGIRGEAVKIGTAAGVGAIIGGILGGVEGALAGILKIGRASCRERV